MTTSDQCITCRHYLGLRECEAFPMGIPQTILAGEHDHRRPYPGDQGIRWEALNREAAELMAETDRETADAGLPE